MVSIIPKEKFNAELISGAKRGINWFKSTSPYGYNIAQCVSAAIKEVRRGNEHDAIFWAHQVAISGIQAETFLWELIRVHSIEECGVTNPAAISIVSDAMRLYFDLPDRDDRRYATLAFAVTYLARSEKTRYSNELFQQVVYQLREGTLKLKMPDYAIDLHLPEGRQMGRGVLHYLTEASTLDNEDLSLPTEPREWLNNWARLKEQKQS